VISCSLTTITCWIALPNPFFEIIGAAEKPEWPIRNQGFLPEIKR